MIYKVVISLQKPTKMQQINYITDIDNDVTDNWVDLQIFEENPELRKFITDKEFNMLKSKTIDCVVFRMDY
jgi:hypothetical protein